MNVAHLAYTKSAALSCCRFAQQQLSEKERTRTWLIMAAATAGRQLLHALQPLLPSRQTAHPTTSDRTAAWSLHACKAMHQCSFSPGSIMPLWGPLHWAAQLTDMLLLMLPLCDLSVASCLTSSSALWSPLISRMWVSQLLDQRDAAEQHSSGYVLPMPQALLALSRA